jgi:two-component system sensor histidine kinase CreC
MDTPLPKDPAVVPEGSSNAPGRNELLERAVHDLKNPLAVVRASLEWLEVELADREDALDAVRDATVASARLLTIVEDLDALAHLDAGRAAPHGRVELSSIVGALTASAGARFESRGLAVVSNAPATLETQGDARLLTRALSALLDVAARGAPAGSCIELTARLTSRSIEIDVGLQGAVAEGDPISCLDALSSGGLGVYVALQIATAHGGTLHVVPTATVPRMLLGLPH